MNNTFTICDISDTKLFYQNVVGRVLSTEKFSETEVSSSGGFSFGIGKYYQQANTQTNMRSCINHQIWLQTEDGEKDFIFYDCDIPLREHHNVTITLVSANGEDYYPAALTNHTTGENYAPQNAPLEEILGLVHKSHKKAYYNNLLYIMEDVNNNSLASIDHHTKTGNPESQEDIAGDIKPVAKTIETLTSSQTKTVHGSFVINTQNYDKFLIERLIGLPQKMSNTDVPAVQAKALCGIGLRFISLLLFLSYINMRELSFDINGWEGKSLFVTPIVFLFIITGITFQIFAIKSLQKISHSKTVLWNAIIFNILFVMPLIQVHWWQKWIFLTFVSYIISIALIFYAYKYYQELSILTEQKYFIAVLVAYIIGEVLYQTETFVFWGTFLTTIIALSLESMAWYKLQKIQQCINME